MSTSDELSGILDAFLAGLDAEARSAVARFEDEMLLAGVGASLIHHFPLADEIGPHGKTITNAIARAECTTRQDAKAERWDGETLWVGWFEEFIKGIIKDNTRVPGPRRAWPLGFIEDTVGEVDPEYRAPDGGYHGPRHWERGRSCVEEIVGACGRALYEHSPTIRNLQRLRPTLRELTVLFSQDIYSHHLTHLDVPLDGWIAEAWQLEQHMEWQWKMLARFPKPVCDLPPDKEEEGREECRKDLFTNCVLSRFLDVSARIENEGWEHLRRISGTDEPEPSDQAPSITSESEADGPASALAIPEAAIPPLPAREQTDTARADSKPSDEPARVEQATVDGVVASGSSKSEQAGGAVPATDEARPAQPSPATVMNIGNATDRRGAEIILDSAPLSLADRAEIEQQLDQWRDGISVDIALLLGWSGRLEVTIPPKSMEYFRELQPELRNRSFLRLAFDWEGSGSEILSHDQITATLLNNLQRGLKRYARRAIGLISSKWANTGIHPNAFAARMELAAEALEDDINQRLKDGVSALAHGASTDSLEIALWEEVKTGIARKIDLYRRNAQLVGLSELPQRDDVVPECRATKASASPLPEGVSNPPLPAREQTDTADADSRGSHEPAQPQPVTVSDLSEPNPTLHPIRPEDAYAGIIQLGTVSGRKERVVPRSEYQAWLQKLKSLALLGAKYRRRSVVPNVSALQKLHVDAMDLLLGIGPPVSGIREELEDLKLALYISQRYDWREAHVYPDKIRRFTKLLIAAHRLLEREQRVSCVAATDRAETFPPAAVEKTVGPTGDAVIVASVGHAVGEGRHRVSHWEGTVIQEIASGLSEAGDRKKTDRIAQVEAFVSRCRQEKGVKVMKKHIWLAVGHKKARQFQYWQAGQNRLPGETRGATQRDDENFRRILAMTPLDFKALLKKMGIA